MAKNTSPDSVDSVVAAANAASPGHQYTGSAVPSATAVGPQAGQSRPRNATAGDPALQPVAARQATMERMGAAYRVSAGIHKPVDPSISGSTLSNVRLLGPATIRGDFAGQ